MAPVIPRPLPVDRRVLLIYGVGMPVPTEGHVIADDGEWVHIRPAPESETRAFRAGDLFVRWAHVISFGLFDEDISQADAEARKSDDTSSGSLGQYA